MSQETVWDAEYKNPKLVSGTLEPQLDFKHFIKYWRKTTKQDLEGAKVLDLGSGIGKHALFLAERGASVEGLEISDTAIKKAKAVTQERGYESLVTYRKQSVGVAYPFPDGHFDLVIDVLTSNSLRVGERAVYIQESARVLKLGGWMFVKILCLFIVLND
jgi:ubiquinone/menaquinone biosynthesis C-methylase UbiE